MENMQDSVSPQNNNEQRALLLAKQQSSNNDVSCSTKLHGFLTSGPLFFAEGVGIAGPAGYLAGVFPTLSFGQFGTPEYVAIGAAVAGAISLGFSVASFSSYCCCVSSQAPNQKEPLTNEPTSSYQSVQKQLTGDEVWNKRSPREIALEETSSHHVRLDVNTDVNTSVIDSVSGNNLDAELSNAQMITRHPNTLSGSMLAVDGQLLGAGGPPTDYPPDLPWGFSDASSEAVVEGQNITLPPPIFSGAGTSTSEPQPPTDLPPSLFNNLPKENSHSDENGQLLQPSLQEPNDLLPTYNASNTVRITPSYQSVLEQSSDNVVTLTESENEQGTFVELDELENKQNSPRETAYDFI